jgi:hypothetical protein
MGVAIGAGTLNGGHAMGNFEFGLTMIVVGMGGTLTVLGLFAVLMNLLKIVFPHREDQAAK